MTSKFIPYVQHADERCERDADCALVRGHEGACYLIAWLFSEELRKKLREIRGGR